MSNQLQRTWRLGGIHFRSFNWARLRISCFRGCFRGATGEHKVSVRDNGKLIEMINELEMIGWQWNSQSCASKLSFISGPKPVPQVTSCGATSTARIAWPGLTKRLVPLLAGLCWMAFSTDKDACLHSELPSLVSSLFGLKVVWQQMQAFKQHRRGQDHPRSK